MRAPQSANPFRERAYENAARHALAVTQARRGRLKAPGVVNTLAADFVLGRLGSAAPLAALDTVRAKTKPDGVLRL